MLNSDLTKNSYLTPEEIDCFFETPRASRKSRKANRKEKRKNQNVNNVQAQAPLELKSIRPLTETQREIFESFQETNQNLFLHGYAGTGKSFVSLYLLMEQLFLEPSYKKLIIVRSTVPSRDQGFLPGSAAEKAKVYERPYESIFSDLFGRSNAYEHFKKRKQVEFESTSYLRGNTFNDCLVLFDEFQNADYAEAMTVLTRIGENCRLIISGDFNQTDLKRDSEKRGILDIIKILKRIRSVDFFEFKKEDIVRSGFVKELIIAESEYKRNKN